MTKNDKYSLILVAVATVLFFIGYFMSNTSLTMIGFILILIGAGAYKGGK